MRECPEKKSHVNSGLSARFSSKIPFTFFQDKKENKLLFEISSSHLRLESTLHLLIHCCIEGLRDFALKLDIFSFFPRSHCLFEGGHKLKPAIWLI